MLLVAHSTSNGGELERRTPAGIDVGPIAVDPGGNGYFIYKPSATPADSAVMKWNPPGPPTPVMLFSDLKIDANAVFMVRATGDGRLVLASLRQFWIADPSSPKEAAKLLFSTTTGLPEEITFSPAGMLVHLSGYGSPSARVDLLAQLTPGSPRDLVQEIKVLASPGGCPSTISHHPATDAASAGGTIHGSRYLYEGIGGLFAVTVTSTGVESVTRLTALPIKLPRVTEGGALFGLDCRTDQTKCRFMYAGRAPF
jgi:hypothetical protein